jgi:hypothetical protein
MTSITLKAELANFQTWAHTSPNSWFQRTEGIEFAKTMNDEHHYSIYAPPDFILALVVGESVPKE